MRNTAGSILFIFTLLYIGCAPSLMQKAAKLKYPSLPKWPTAYHQNFRKMHHLQSKVRITVESPAVATNFTASFLYAAPDTLFLQAEGPFGVDVGKIFIGKNRFIVYNQYENQFFSGSLEEAYYNTFLQTNFTFKQIQNAVLGYAPLPDNLKLVDRQHGVYAAMVNNKKWRFVVNPATGTLENWTIYENSDIVYKQEFKNYVNLEGFVFPRFVRVLLPKRTEMISIHHKDIKLNEDFDSKIYHIEVSPKVNQLIAGG